MRLRTVLIGAAGLVAAVAVMGVAVVVLGAGVYAGTPSH
jgi:hypothetical protein